MEYSASAIKVVSSNPCLGPLPRIKIDLFISIISKCRRTIINSKYYYILNKTIFHVYQMEYHVWNKNTYYYLHSLSFFDKKNVQTKIWPENVKDT